MITTSYNPRQLKMRLPIFSNICQHRFNWSSPHKNEPNLPLSRLRARTIDRSTRCRLAFFFIRSGRISQPGDGLALSAEDITTLESRTEGWIAGLQLAAISLQGRQDSADLIKSFSGSHRFVLDYLIEEVLEQQPESVQTFLLHTTILDQLTGSLCDRLLP